MKGNTVNYNNILNEKVVNMKPSGIRKFFDLVDNMEGIIALTVGQPDFVTPWHIREKAIESIENGKTYYTANSGLFELRKEIGNYLNRKFSLSYDPASEILVTIGGSEAIDICIRSLVAPGDEVIIPEPSFVCYRPLTELVGGVPVVVNTKEEDSFKLTPEALKAAITPKTKLLVFPYPNNPTGAIMTKKELEKIAEVLDGTDIIVLSDEIYGELTYGTTHTSIASIPGMRERTVFISGFSKAYAMTGWRLGYLCAPEMLTKQIYKIHQYAIMCSPTVSQNAAIEALRNGDADVKYMVGEYDKRRKILLNGLRSIGIDCFEPHGAFYLFPSVKKFGLSSEEFCERLLYEHKVAIVPGGAFGECGEGFARISYAYSVKHIEKALESIEKFVKSLN